MHCATCGAAAQPNARFCVECGASLGRRCAGCGFDNPSLAKFCAGCGAGLAAAETSAAPAREDVAERRPLTVMFCDLVDSTVMSTRLDPEDYRDVIFTYQRTVAREIERFSGFVAKYMGDGVLAYFGFPTAQEDDAERSIRAGLAVAAAVQAIASSAGKLCARIGIATGQVIVGDLVGEGVAREQAIAGETPNLAARLQAMADGGGVVICRDTRALVGELFELSPMGLVALKGFDQPQRAYRVRAANDRLSRFEALRSQDSSFVGREEELAILARRWARAQDGEPQIVLISADAGVGKSRLMSTFRHQLAEEEGQALNAYCAPYARDSAFHPFLQSLERRCGLVVDDSPEARRGKVQALLNATLGEPPAEALEILASLLSLPAAVRLSPQRQRDEASQLFADLVLRTIVRELGAGLKLMLMLSYRPEFRPPVEWLGQPNVTSMALSRLRAGEARDMLAQIAVGRDLDKTAVEQILTHADGVPLYIEEITRAVLERGESGALGGAEISVPTTLQASLLGRLDRLSYGKEVAQIGAAIGRDFSRPLLAAVAGKSEAELDGALTELIQAELIVPRGIGPSATYLFRHALIQDVAYGALLRGPRQSLHGRIAVALAEALPELAEARPEMLARHLTEAQRWRDAVAQWRKAAVRTLRGGAWNEGLRQLEAGLRAVRALPEGDERDRFELDLQMMVGGVSMGAVGHSAPAAQSAYERAYQLARDRGEWRNAALAGSRLWLSAYGAGDMVGGEVSAQRVLDDLGPHLTPVEHALIYDVCSSMLFWQGRFAEAAVAHEETRICWAEPINFAPEEYYFMDGAVQGVIAQMELMLVTGRYQAWLEARQDTSDRLETMSPMGAVICLTMLIYTRYVAADWESRPAELARFDAAISRIEGAAHYRNLSRLVGARLKTRGGYRAALDDVAAVMGGAEIAFALQHLPRYQMIAGDAYADAGEPDQARAYYEGSLKGGPHGSQQWLRSEVLRRLGDLAVKTFPLDAERLYVQARGVARSQGALLFELRSSLSLARLGGTDALVELAEVCDRFSAPGPELEAARRFLDTQATSVTAGTLKTG
jgi:class 3 adenylate cyclase/tetratricopeptide (TPR) repeat protein